MDTPRPIKITIMNDMINHDMVNVVNNIDVILEEILDKESKGEAPPKELYILLNESQAVLDSLINMRAAGL